MRVRLSCAGLAWLIAVCVIPAPAADLTFSVASIKTSELSRAGGEGSLRERVAVSPTGVALTNAGVSFCVQWAWNLRFYQVSAPDRFTQDRYDIIARTDQPAAIEQLRVMMQALLADRFQLKLHRETRAQPVYELTAASNTNNLPRSGPDVPTRLTVMNDSFVFSHMTMPEFAAHLSELAGFDRPVIDKTGVEGTFDITLESAARLTREDPSSIFGAVERAGFRLNNRKAPMEILVIDHAGKPSGN